jgi:hypothetical protein
MSEHTKEPWCVNADGIIRAGKKFGNYISPIPLASGWIEGAFAGEKATEESQDNARRIVDCVNACVGADKNTLTAIEATGGLGQFFEAAAEVSKQRDELLAALKSIVDWRDPFTVQQARDAIAKAEAK